ncbi:phosphatidate cytidylyltransferase [Alkanindiges sp. WGS2144]|uniref:phosphatidate cytidylyltransferase n=1 Tax=Alkanindiges sp. WGS2144 TaxID=3366808 RepID=UPI00375060DC
MIERIRTALILVVIVLLCMFATGSPLPMLALMLITVAIAGFEWARLIPNQHQKLYAAGVAVISALAFAVADVWPFLWMLSLLIWLISLIWVTQYPQKTGWYHPALNGVGVVLLVAAVVAIFSLWQQSPWWLMYVFTLVWGADSGAYFAGRALGKHKLAPHVSPNKSIEGLIGGLALTVMIILAVAFTQLDLTPVALTSFIALSIFTVLASVQGDLFESMVKRKAGIKDSGKILPGHGGVLDRIDSLLAAAPVFALGLWLQQQFLGGF